VPVSDAARILLGFLGVGAGLVHLALASGAPAGVGVPLAALGLAELAWSVVAMARSRPPLLRGARWMACIAVAAWPAVLIVAGSADLGPLTAPQRLLPMLVATLFDLALAVGITIVLRRRPRPRELRPGALIAILFVAALGVGALATPALAASRAGSTAHAHFESGHHH
jgi:hypothetical protein